MTVAAAAAAGCWWDECVTRYGDDRGRFTAPFSDITRYLGVSAQIWFGSPILLVLPVSSSFSLPSSHLPFYHFTEWKFFMCFQRSSIVVRESWLVSDQKKSAFNSRVSMKTCQITTFSKRSEKCTIFCWCTWRSLISLGGGRGLNVIHPRCMVYTPLLSTDRQCEFYEF